MIEGEVENLTIWERVKLSDLLLWEDGKVDWFTISEKMVKLTTWIFERGWSWQHDYLRGDDKVHYFTVSEKMVKWTTWLFERGWWSSQLHYLREDCEVDWFTISEKMVKLITLLLWTTHVIHWWTEGPGSKLTLPSAQPEPDL